MSAHFHSQFPNSDIIRYQRAGREAASAACLGKQQSLWNLQNHAETLLEHCRNLAGTEILREFSGKLVGILLVWNILLSRALLEPCPPAGTSWWSLSGTMPCCNLPALPRVFRWNLLLAGTLSEGWRNPCRCVFAFPECV